MVLSHRGLLRRGGRGGWGRARPASCAWAGWWAPWACVAYGPRVGLSTRARSTRGTLGKEDARLQSEDAPTRMRAPRVYECHEWVDGERARHPVFRHLRHPPHPPHPPTVTSNQSNQSNQSNHSCPTAAFRVRAPRVYECHECHEWVDGERARDGAVGGTTPSCLPHASGGIIHASYPHPT